MKKKGDGNQWSTKKWKSFVQARKFVHKQNLKNYGEWLDYKKSGKLPDDIPRVPEGAYKNKGWVSWGDFLGNGVVANQNRNYLSFEEAREFARSLKFKTGKEWVEYCKSGKRPSNIPGHLDRVYKNKGWNGMMDFLGYKKILNHNKEYRSFEEAREFARSLKLKGWKEWVEYCKSGKRPDDIPSAPNHIYHKQGKWVSWGDFLGTGFVAASKRKYRSFEDAREFVHTLNLKSQKEWKEYCESGKKPKDIPQSPQNIFQKQWKGLGDWLGTGIIAYQDRNYRSFEEARKFIHSLNLNSQKEWKEYCNSGKKPDDIPKTPDFVYKKQGVWTSWGDWFGTGFVAASKRNYLSFEESRKFARSLKLKGKNDWEKYVKSSEKPDDIPFDPSGVYGRNNEWTSWGDFLGTGNVANQNRNYRSFEEAKKFVRSLKIKWQKEWKEYCNSGKKPKDIPTNLAQTYKKEWTSWGDFLGTGYIAMRNRVYLPIKDAKIEAREIAMKLGIKTAREWSEAWRAGKVPPHLPSNLQNVYGSTTTKKEDEK